MMAMFKGELRHEEVFPFPSGELHEVSVCVCVAHVCVCVCLLKLVLLVAIRCSKTFLPQCLDSANVLVTSS